jgi:hypothetical protein
MDLTFLQSTSNRAAVAALAGCLSVYFSIGREDSSEMAIFGMVGLALLAYAASQMVR